MTLVIKREQVIFVIICILLGCTSLQMGLPFSVKYCDEISFLLLAAVTLYYNKKIILDKEVKAFGMYIILSIIIVIINTSSLEGYFIDIYNNIKVILVFVIFSQVKISDEMRNKIFKFFLVVNIPSICYSFYQYKNRDLGWEIGLKVRDDVGRISGLLPHAIWYGFVLLSMFIIVVELDIFKTKQKNKTRCLRVGMFIGFIATDIFLLNATKSRYALVLLYLTVVIWLLRKIDIRNRFLLIGVSILVIILALIIGDQVIRDFILSENSSVRMQGLVNIPNAILNYPLGSGIGTFGGEGSMITGSEVYSVLGMVMPDVNSAFNPGNYYESTMVQRIVEMGIVGFCLYFYIIVRPLKYSKYCNDWCSVLLLLVFSLNALFNAAYQFPLIVLAAVSYSNLKYNYKYKNEIEKNIV